MSRHYSAISFAHLTNLIEQSKIITISAIRKRQNNFGTILIWFFKCNRIGILYCGKIVTKLQFTMSRESSRANIDFESDSSDN